MSLYDSLNEGSGRNVAFNDLPALAWARANDMRYHALALVHLAWQANAAVESTATVRGISDAKRKAEAAGLIAPGLSTGDALTRVIRELTSAGMPPDMADPWIRHYRLSAVESESDPVSTSPVDPDAPVARSLGGEPQAGSAGWTTGAHRWGPEGRGGTAYVAPSRTAKAREVESAIFLRNPDLIDRGTTAHMDLQDELAEYIRREGLEPVSPDRDDQPFDVAWVAQGALYICEVKSLTDDNEESQLRLGLGQLLSYLYRTEVEHWADVNEVLGVLAVERPPSRLDWVGICAESGVTLTWPDRFPELFEG